MSSRSKTTASASLLQALKRDESFVHFSLGIDKEDAARLGALNVSREDTYDNFGAGDKVQDETAQFLEALGNSKEEAAHAAGVINGLVEETLRAFGAEAAWVAVRATLPNSDFEIPRWHQDGVFFESENGEQKKVAFAVKGAPTLFNGTGGKLRDAFREASRRKEDDTPESRLEVAALLDPAQTEQAKAGQGSVFVAGSDRSAVHSEPSMKDPRIFVSVLPGTKEQIEELRERWNRPKTTLAPKPATGQP